METQVSVVIPTYNHAPYLREALVSLRAQTFDSWEAIIIDNHSTDSTPDVIRAFGDTRVRHVLFANRGVIAASRNLGARQARAPFIAFLDSDDYWTPEKLARSVSVLEEGADVVCHAEAHVSATGELLFEKSYGPEEKATYRNLVMHGNCLSTSAITMRRSRFEEVGGFSEAEAFITAEDYELWLRLAAAGARFRFLPSVLGSYRTYETSASGSLERHNRAVRAVLDHHAAKLGPLDPMESIRLARRRALVDFMTARSYLDRADTTAAWSWFRKSMSQFPLPVRGAYLSARLLKACLKTDRLHPKGHR